MDDEFKIGVEGRLVRDLTDTPAFRRLKEVSFLGAVDYFNYSNSKLSTKYFTRADHVKGVLSLANRLINSIEFSDEERLYVIATAICHDFGHGPFSHSSERAFRIINPKIDHHKVLNYIFEQDLYNVRECLRDYYLDYQKIFLIAEGRDEKLGWIFGNPINIDTLDGMWRFLESFNLASPFNKYEAVESLSFLYNGKSISSSSTRNLDLFWSIKASFYEIFLTRGVYANYEYAFVKYILNNKSNVEYDDYLSVDRDLSEKIGLTPNRLRLNAEPRRPSSRHLVEFRIDESVELNSIGDLYRRYLRRRVGDESQRLRR